jgi:predicted nuclease of predicted toxin-antitoxin system
MSESEISFLLDEHIPSSVAEELGGRGVDVKTVYELDLDGTPDTEILEFAEKGDRVIVSQDSDFLKHDEKHPGLVFLTEPLGIGDLTRELARVLENFESEDLENSTIYIPWS